MNDSGMELPNFFVQEIFIGIYWEFGNFDAVDQPWQGINRERRKIVRFSSRRDGGGDFMVLLKPI